MKRRFLLAGSLAFLSWVLQGRPQQDSIPQKVRKTEIELVYNQYIQDGDHSAITGGIGTESLQVYGPSLSMKKTTNNQSFGLQFGADIITSASTDNIDDVVSSASSLDTRGYMQTSFVRKLPSKNINIGGGGGVSIESDYFSLQGFLSIKRKSADARTNYGLILRYYNDDLRWGRVTQGIYEPRTLVYPKELRGKQSLDVYKRHSFNATISYDYILNRRNILGLFSSLIYQRGLLSTPFHRIYFDNNEVGLERLPNERTKLSIAAKLNTYIREKWITKHSFQTYFDDFGIRSFQLEHESIYKWNLYYSWIVKVRLYTQSESLYFNENRKHDILSEFHTSDFDLSSFSSLQLTGGLKFIPYWKWGKSFYTDAIQLTYAYYIRTDGLNAHILTAAFQFRNEKY